MKKATCFIWFCVFLFSCNNNRFVEQSVVDFLHLEINKNTLKKDGLVNISIYKNLPLFVLINNGHLALTNVEQLNNIYISSYNKEYESFKLFLSKSLNQEKILDKSDFENLKSSIFMIDTVIKNDYERMKFQDFFNKYLEKKNDYLNINNEKISNKTQEFTLMYYLSINNYYCSFDDYGGGIWQVKNWNDIIKNKTL